MDGIHVVHRDGTRVPFDANKINLALVKASEGLPDQISKVVQVATELQLTLFDGITTEQLDEAVIQTALQNIKDDPDFDKIAARLLLKNIYKNILGDFDTKAELKKLHAQKFPSYIKNAVADGLLDKRMNDGRYDLKKLAAALEPEHDELFKYIGVVTNKNRYALRKNSGAPLETPQFTHMRIAMGLAYNEEDPTAAALEFYDHMAKLEYVTGGSTRVNAGGAFPQLSNCFLMEVQDDMESIAKSVRDTMWIAKGTGGIGITMTKLRAAGSPVQDDQHRVNGPNSIYEDDRLCALCCQPQRQESRRSSDVSRKLAPKLSSISGSPPKLWRPILAYSYHEHRRLYFGRIHETRRS